MGCMIQKHQNVLNSQDLVDQDFNIVNQIQPYKRKSSQSLKTILQNRQFDMGPIFLDIDQPKFYIEGMKSIQKFQISSTDDSLEENNLQKQQLAKSILKKTRQDHQFKNDNDKLTQSSERCIKKVEFRFSERHFCQRNKIKGQKCYRKKCKSQSVTMQQLDDEFE